MSGTADQPDQPSPTAASPLILDYETSAAVQKTPTSLIRCVEKEKEITIVLPPPRPSDLQGSSLYDRTMLKMLLRSRAGIWMFAAILLIGCAFVLVWTGIIHGIVFWLVFLPLQLTGLVGPSVWLARWLNGDASLRLDETKLSYRLAGRRAQRTWTWDRNEITAVTTDRQPWWLNTNRPHYLLIELRDQKTVRLPSIGSDPDTTWIAQFLTRRLQGLTQSPPTTAAHPAAARPAHPSAQIPAPPGSI